MTTTAPAKRKLGEPNAHVMMRHARLIFLLFLIVTLIATMVLFIFYREAAYVAALPVVPLFLALVFVSYLERQSRADKIRVKNQTKISSEEVELNVQYAGIYTAMGLVTLVAIATFIIAATMVEDWSMVGFFALALFLLTVLITLPYIPLFIEESAQDERDKLGREASEVHGREAPEVQRVGRDERN